MYIMKNFKKMEYNKKIINYNFIVSKQHNAKIRPGESHTQRNIENKIGIAKKLTNEFV